MSCNNLVSFNKLMVILILISFSQLSRCSSDPNSNQEPYTYNLSEFKLTELELSQLVESVDYVQLETTSESLIQRGEAKLFGDKIIIKNSNPAAIFIYSKNGKVEKVISKYGKGPGKYVNISSWDVSPNGL